MSFQARAPMVQTSLSRKNLNATNKLSVLTMAVTAALAANMFAGTAIAQQEQAAESQPRQGIERINILGSAAAVNEAPGSAYYMSEEELREFEYTDIMRALGNVPGVYVLEEDGWGLRPNIGMRGTGVNRSDKITVMEDGILSAPAPYSAPAAYYFPTFARIEAMEILKGSSSIQYGPRTTGGVLNLVSRSIPNEDLAGFVDIGAGEHGFGKLHTYMGGSGERAGGVFEVLRYQADGFKDVANGESGFYRNDIMSKVRVSLDDAGRHQVEFKFKYSDEVSDDTYMGLTDADYQASPYARYAASQLDEMSTEHTLLQATHQWALASGGVLTSAIYRNEFARNWYKADQVGGVSLSGGGLELASAFEAGAAADETLSVRVKNNNRSYLSQGVQTQYDFAINGNEYVLGARYHEDEEDRFQWVDLYDMDAALNMALVNAGVPGTDANRVASAEAFAAFAKARMYFDALTLDFGARVEDIKVKREDFGADLQRLGTPGLRENSTSAFLPAAGLTYRLTDSWVALAGVQKGFAPAAPGNNDQRNEESWNYEAGVRYAGTLDFGYISGDARFEVIGFYSDYSNMHGNCTAAQGCDLSNIGAQVNAGEVEVMGVEVLGAYSYALNDALDIALDAAYTFTNAEFQNSFNSNIGIWGNVTAGDEIPYQPEQQLRTGVALKGGLWSLALNARHLGEMRTVAGVGNVAADEKIAARTLFDMAARYQLTDNQSVYVSVDNLTDKTYITTRMHGGVMVGKPRQFNIGYQARF
ncbi:outer membrane receptor for Fe3+-dicitrate [Idiomarina sp. A28L]|uniref:TonB-dependent receptor family protein n=1 Tax=Idiomarina sp. A28L TaxID=1036674 RepID=UPI0002138CCC|nr:TonB-dependent receptor [Idiomarina sp. A28L]EGN74628.1 outer membrane receptor for Fe3+-dicitrate [Idiomarina sp. A28L]